MCRHSDADVSKCLAPRPGRRNGLRQGRHSGQGRHHHRDQDRRNGVWSGAALTSSLSPRTEETIDTLGALVSLCIAVCADGAPSPPPPPVPLCSPVCAGPCYPGSALSRRSKTIKVWPLIVFGEDRSHTQTHAPSDRCPRCPNPILDRPPPPASITFELPFSWDSCTRPQTPPHPDTLANPRPVHRPHAAGACVSTWCRIQFTQFTPNMRVVPALCSIGSSSPRVG